MRAWIFGLMFCLPWLSPAQAIVGEGATGGPRSVVMVLSSAQGAGFCSGVLLAPDIVLTAAHCVSSAATTRVHYKKTDGSPVLVGVGRVAKHAGFRDNAIAARKASVDLALVQTQEALPSEFSAARLGAASGTEGATFTVSGFGLTQEGSARSGGVQHYATLRLRAPVSKLLLWLEGDAGACAGDSGGPVFQGDAVVGVIAFASGAGKHRCGALTQAVRVAPFQNWIDATLASWR